MKQLKQITQFVTERKRQDVCSGCGKSIEDSEKECPTCGAFPHKAYHERAAAKTLGISKWLQNSPVMQPNQKLSEETKTENMNNIIKFTEFVESRVHENENLPEWDFLDQACLEEGLDEGLNEGKNDSSDLMGKIKSFISSITGKISKGMGQESVDPKVNGLLISVSKGIADSMKKAGNNPAEFRKELAASQQMKTISAIYVNSLQKLIASVKADPSVLLSKQVGQTLGSLYLVRKVARESILKQNKDFSEILNKEGNYKSTKPAPGKPGAKPGAKPAPGKPGEAKPEQPAPTPQPTSSSAPDTSTETPASTEDKKTE